MQLADIVGLAGNGVRARKLRSALTALGIIIGAAAFVALVLVASTIEGSILDQLGDLGGDQISVTPGVTQLFNEDGGGPPQAGQAATDIFFTADDEQAVARAPGITQVLGIYSGRVEAEFRGDKARLGVQGVDPQAWAEMTTPELAAGRLLADNDGRNVILGAGVASGLFPFELGINQQIELDGVRYRVVGILEEEGGGDQTIYMNREELWTLLDEPDKPRAILVAKRSPESSEEDTALAVEQALLRSRGLNPQDIDFTIITPTAIRESIAAITATVNVFLGSISGISLLVGGIGIANTMFMTVMERAKQIGILKAVGMTRNDVIKLFLIESALLGFLGGLIGGGLGAVAAQFVAGPLAESDPPGMLITIETVARMTGLAVLIGSIAGVLPAIRAASVPPMESLQGQ